MILDIFISRFPRLKPETKWLLILLVERFIDDQAIRVDASQLSHEFHIPKKAIYKSLKELCELGLFDEHQIFLPRKRHVNAYDFKFSQFNELTEILGIEKNFYNKLPNTPNRNRILKLIHNQPFDKLYLKLKSPSKLLIFTLLILADETGIVNYCYKKDLSKLTGMSLTRVDAHLKKLLELGYIRSKVNGIKNNKLFDCSPDVYYLDLCHSSFEYKIVYRDTVIIKPAIKEDNDNLEVNVISNVVNIITRIEAEAKAKAKLEAEALIWQPKCPYIIHSDVTQERIHIKSSRYFNVLPCYCRHAGYRSYKNGVWFAGYIGFPDFSKIKDIFIKGLTKNARDFFQYKIEKYASILLETSWDDLGKKGPIINYNVLNLIEKEIIPDSIKAKNNSGSPLSSSQIKILHDFIFSVSVGLAQWVQCLLNRTDINPSSKRIMLKSKLVRKSIQPKEKKTSKTIIIRTLVIEFYNFNSASMSTERVFELLKPIGLHKQDSYEIINFRQRESLTEEEKLEYGLLTYPQHQKTFSSE